MQKDSFEKIYDFGNKLLNSLINECRDDLIEIKDSLTCSNRFNNFDSKNDGIEKRQQKLEANIKKISADEKESTIFCKEWVKIFEILLDDLQRTKHNFLIEVERVLHKIWIYTSWVVKENPEIRVNCEFEIIRMIKHYIEHLENNLDIYKVHIKKTFLKT